MREPSASAEAAAEVLDRLGARWALAGALAALEYRSTPRLTTDADILVARVPGLAEAFEAAGYDVTRVADGDEPPHLLVVRGHGGRVDIMIATVEYQEVALERAVDHVLTVEDVIIHKLIGWRPRDRDDIASILDTGLDLDLDYIHEWAAAWQVDDRWEQARRRT